VGYALIFYGINLVYTSFGQSRATILFMGSSLFLVGLLLFLLNNFSFADPGEIIFPSILFIVGINFLMLFLDNPDRRKYLAVSVTSIISGIIVTAILGSVTIKSFYKTALDISAKYWPVLLVAVVLLFIIHREGKKSL